MVRRRLSAIALSVHVYLSPYGLLRVENVSKCGRPGLRLAPCRGSLRCLFRPPRWLGRGYSPLPSVSDATGTSSILFLVSPWTDPSLIILRSGHVWNYIKPLLTGLVADTDWKMSIHDISTGCVLSLYRWHIIGCVHDVNLANHAGPCDNVSARVHAAGRGIRLAHWDAILSVDGGVQLRSWWSVHSWTHRVAHYSRDGHSGTCHTVGYML